MSSYIYAEIKYNKKYTTKSQKLHKKTNQQKTGEYNHEK